jgi:serine/threonine-protein kinase
VADVLDRLKAALSDRYRIERELGSGGMATVYLAQDLKHERQVAVKVLRPELAASLGADRFLREIKITANLNHPHILPLLDSGEADSFLYYVMPYVEGESLRDRLNREKQLPIPDALKIASEVADALGSAHRHSVIHRDIKPENVLQEEGHAVVADFGIARAVSQAGGDKLTETGISVGTPSYMSPEQASGERELDGRSDIYALGCVLYEMLAGQAPFTGPTAESIVHQHIASGPPSVTGLRPLVPEAVANTITRSLAKSPADRYQSAEELGTQLSTEQVTISAPTVTARSKPRVRLMALVGSVAVVIAVIIGVWVRERLRTPTHPRTAIAVLPFENLSADGPHAYFTGGLHGELLTQFAKVAEIKVIGRTSVMAYEGSTKRLSEIGEELEVGSIVEGSVQVVGDQLRVNVQITDAATEANLWAERYDRTLDDAFAIQSDVAQQVVAAVGATLTESEEQLLADAPTANAEAYRLYLQGHEYFWRPGLTRQNLESAQQLYERALLLDSTFALAHAGLAHVHGQMSWLKYDPSPERIDRQREEAETALRLAPDLPQAHVAMGRAHYVGRRDWQAALDEYATALQALPNDATLWQRIGYVHRRLGNWDEVDAAFHKAAQLDPRDVNLFADLGGNTYLLTRRYADAIAALNRAHALAPDYQSAAVLKGLAYLNWKSELDTLRAALDQAPPDGLSRMRVQVLLLERKRDSLLALLGNEPDAVVEGRISFLPASLWAAWAHELRGDGVASHAAFDSARILLDSVLAALPDDWRVHSARGLALAGLERREEALLEARWLQQSVEYRDDAYDRPIVAEARAQILAQAGDADAALDEIEQILIGPGWFVSAATLRLDPRWDPIRGDPRFQALLERYGNQSQ